MRTQSKTLILSVLTITMAGIAPAAAAGGVIGDIFRAAGRATGIRPIEDLGKNADEEHKRFKNNNPVYKKVEETASEIVRTPFSLACTTNFEAIVGVVRASCSRFSSQSFSSSNQSRIDQAKRRLIDLGVISQSEFSGISVQWCQGSFNGYGITPGPTEIFLNTELLSQTTDDIALTLAHEMHHVRQYRSMGAGPFKCNYSQQFIQCGGCQDNSHPMEREAYQFEASVAATIANILPAQESGQRVATFSSLRGRGTFLDDKPIHVQPSSPQDQKSRIKAAVARLARSTCTLEEKSSSPAPTHVVAPCIDDLEVIYAEVSDWMIKDFENNDLEKEKYYRETFQEDIDSACQILAHTVKDVSWQKTRVSLCRYGAKSSITRLRQIIAE